MVWKSFGETLNKRKDVHVLFDSTKIPNEIIDTVAIPGSLDKPWQGICLRRHRHRDAVNSRLANPKTRDDTLTRLRKFSHLTSLHEEGRAMTTYGTPKEGTDILPVPN